MNGMDGKIFATESTDLHRIFCGLSVPSVAKKLKLKNTVLVKFVLKLQGL